MFKRFFKRFSVDADQRRVEAIGEWARTVPDAVPIRDVEPRSVACIAGIVQSLRVQPREGVPSIEASVSDGTGTVTALWLGRRSIAGLNLGARLILRGRFGGGRARLELMNPTYEFAPRADEY